jgi:hypothetical protein
MVRSPCLPVFFCLILLHSSEAQSQFVFSRVAVTNEPIEVFVGPNLEPMVFESMSGPIVDLYGNVAFLGSIHSQSGSEEGIWVHEQSLSRLTVHVKENSRVPDNRNRPDAFFGGAGGQSTFGPIKLLGGTEYIYRARLKNGETSVDNDTATYRRGWQVLREGEPFDFDGQVGDQFAFDNLAPETSRRAFPLLNPQSSRDTAIQLTDGRLLVEGSRASQGYLGDLRNARPLLIPLSINIVFRGTVTGSEGAVVPNSQAIFVQDVSRSGPNVVARAGMAPRRFPDLQFESFNHPTATVDSVHYGVRLSGPNVDASNDTAIAGGTIDPGLWFREGDPQSGIGPGNVLGDLGTDNVIGGGERSILFNNQLVGPDISDQNDWALIAASVDSRGTLDTRTIAREGQYVTGLPANSILAGLDAPHFQFNFEGEAIFNAQYVGPNGSGDGLFYAHVDELEPRLILRTGQPFDIGGGDFRTISKIGLMEMANPLDGRASQINDAGQITFNLTFSDGSQGVFTAVIPEPSAIALVTFGLIIAILVAFHQNGNSHAGEYAGLNGTFARRSLAGSAFPGGAWERGDGYAILRMPLTTWPETIVRRSSRPLSV